MADSGGGDLASRYEAVRAVALAEGLAGAGLGAALLVAQGMAAWMRGWKACSPPNPHRRDVEQAHRSERIEVVDVLATMALACAGGT